VVSALRALFGYARERGLIVANPAGTIEVTHREPPPWADDAAVHDDDLDAPPPPPDDDVPTDTWAWDDQPAAPRPLDLAEPHGRPLPEALVSLVLRFVIVVFLIITLASLAQALLTPA
jgi:hypothetical protein